MSKQTGLLIPPSLDEVQLHASKIGLPDQEAEKFYYYYEMVGWRTGKAGLKMCSWKSAMSLWQMKWREEVENTRVNGSTIASKDARRLAKEAQRL